ncbi:MAG: hypothetical protein OHK0044_07100 [Burkholderiaceae bacterium]
MRTKDTVTQVSRHARSAVAAFLSIVASCAALAADGADPAARSDLRPDRLTLWHGTARDARATAAGLQWDLPWRRAWGRGTLTAHAELNLGHWRADAAGDDASAVSTQVGVTPVLRYAFDGAAGWFVEAGIGANVIAPVYRSRDKRFSTAFNFGDHVGVGWRSSTRPGWSLALRVQHFSNAGIARPNPGENFLQIQFAYDLR